MRDRGGSNTLSATEEGPPPSSDAPSRAEPGRSQLQPSKSRRGRVPQWSRKTSVIDGINFILGDLDTILEQIAVQGPDHVHAHEVILTVGLR